MSVTNEKMKIVTNENRLEKLKHFGTIGFAQHMDPKSQCKIAKFVKL